ncbi:hypothetical protein ECE50_026345 [Chitinophaga sp. Mgbs1]|uniref:Uncharacterized protein n=1 Tax=Chitinophaga solisilvae TaxID=1233460 RepID=A0A9Q5DBQ7_9BACT|nr:hypothetical protein [Chitinophaga solisilvae]
MTDKRYNEIKAALQARRKEATASPEAASKFIDAVGIRHLIIDDDDNAVIKVKIAPKKKAAAKKNAAK